MAHPRKTFKFDPPTDAVLNGVPLDNPSLDIAPGDIPDSIEVHRHIVVNHDRGTRTESHRVVVAHDDRESA